MVLAMTVSSFNPHTHEGCDPQYGFGKDFNTSFNPHTHEGCDDPFEIEYPRDPSFNPHTHEGCDSRYRGCDLAGSEVSIHTPTKGVTLSAELRHLLFLVSIHTPTKGVTIRLR